MPSKKRIKTRYPGVYYVDSRTIGSNKPDRIYYIRYRKAGKLIEEKAGRQSQDNMTPARASTLRDKKIEEGKKIYQQENHAIETKKNAEKGRWTINRLWEAYESQRTKNRSFESDISRYKNYIKEPLGYRELQNLVPRDINYLKNNLLKQKSPQTVKHILGIIQRLHHFSLKKNLSPGLSFAIDMPKVNNKKTEELKPEQITALLRIIEKSEHTIAGAMMKTALYTGMRRGEMFDLEWKDIDFINGYIFIRGPKGGSYEKIPLNDAARQVFNALPRTSKYVFPSCGGRKRNTVTLEVNSIKTTAGLPKDFRPLHGLRHVYASILAGSGKVDMNTLQKLLTHKTPQMTQRYAHFRDDAMKRASNLAGVIIGRAVNPEKENIEPQEMQLLEPNDINQYDISKKVIKRNKKKKVDKKDKTAITGMRQLKIPGFR